MAAPLDPKALIRRTLFFVILLGIAITYLTFTFKGLTSKYGIDQAQIGREVARGNNLTTKFVRPLAIYQLHNGNKKVDLNSFYDTTHAPLNILIYAGVIKAFGGDDYERYRMGSNQNVYLLDRVIAGTCMLFFIIAIGINYLLVTKIFDAKIGAITAILMMVSANLWEYTISGLPQMLMLCLFSAACYLIWKAIDSQEAGKSPVVPVILAGFIFGLLALAHWLTLWIFVGFLIFAISYFKPRGIIAIFLIVTMGLFIVGPLIFNAQNSDGLLGTAFYYVQGKTGFQQDYMFKGFNSPPMNVKGLVLNTVRTMLLQTHEIHRHVGGFILASAFFLSLLHPFKRTSIGGYRWCILTMWIFASLGMALYGITGSEADPNQLHILFMPMMTAFALALISILWARVPQSQNGGSFALLPFTIIILVAASPFLIKLHAEINNYPRETVVRGYDPNNTNRELHKQIVNPADVIYSDQPWAVAWYADRVSIWTPNTKEGFEKINDIANNNNSNIVAMHFTPLRMGMAPDYTQLVTKQFTNNINLVGSSNSRFYLISKNKAVEEKKK